MTTTNATSVTTTGKKSGGNTTTGGKSKSSSGDGIPSDYLCDEPTLEAENQENVGELTQELSDFSEDFEERMKHSTTVLSTWYNKVAPLIQSKHVRIYAVINSIFTLVNLVLFIVTIITLCYLLLEVIML
uniref:Uncharacterized protein n=1 Tax=Panagrolaimus sp. JU765 TaxID=591449 RepID=A0AC34PYC8_9BILA